MKAIATLIFVLFIGVTSQAQTATEELKVEAIEMTIVADVKIENKTFVKNTEVARLYKRDNARVKKALTFSTKRNRSKLA